jgi:hypothetical protein
MRGTLTLLRINVVVLSMLCLVRARRCMATTAGATLTQAQESLQGSSHVTNLAAGAAAAGHSSS